MAINLLDLFKQQLTDGVLEKVTGLIGGGDNSGSIQKGLMAAAPALLGGIMDKASSKEGAASIFNMLGNGSELAGLANLSTNPAESEGLLTKGQDLVTMALGDKATGVIDMVSSLAGIDKDKSSSLLSVAGSMISGVLGKQKAEGLDLGSFVGLLSNQGSFLDKFAPAGLTSLLGLASFSGISNKLGDLASGALGFAGNTGKAALDGAGKVAGAAAGAVSGAGKAAYDGAGKAGAAAAGAVSGAGKAAYDGAGKVVGGAAGLAGDAGKVAGAATGAATGAAKAGGSLLKKILPWAIGILALLFLFFFLKGCDSDKSILDNVTDAANETTGTVTNAGNSVVDAAGNAVDSTVDAAGNAVDAAGNAITTVTGGIKDASGNFVNAFGDVIGKFFSSDLPNGTKLNIPEGGFEDNFLSYIKDGKFEAGKYYAFDRLYFNTGSSSLSNESINQIENVVAIMKAYPDVKVLFRGHTDNTGSVEGNNKLSASRALAVKANLVEKGIDASRIGTKGMGSVEPIADNATPEGRAKNRRIDVSIVK
ncbi:hypothetical protein ULMA_16280 [Patiriisocius marinus]|uniref:OmpA-like domain-containing protein n=1 Tax=Patiriisocius marinus TaxID=1397112 RepID=A0A5J4J0F7_9FLAO|nr:OmpA family protein [Patiriisocius marinus]GER59520.1 hypothetical protein ULMA_16280 [Patiriisocius marinus]